MLETIRVGATEYKIVERDMLWRADNGCDGQVRFTELEIDLVTEDRPASEVLNTLVHELFHVCYREWHIKPKCGEERTVTALGFAWAAILSQNPELTGVLAELTGYHYE